MLDSIVHFFNLNVTPTGKRCNPALILTGCRLVLSEKSIYSEMEELNFCCLNSNNGFGLMSLELSFEGDVCDYYKFYIQCVTFRINGLTLLKPQRVPSSFPYSNNYYSKFNKDGKMVLGVDYYFETEEERLSVMNCDSFCFEGFMALKNKLNVYSFVCKAQKTNGNWDLLDGNTYKTTKFRSIDSFVH